MRGRPIRRFAIFAFKVVAITAIASSSYPAEASVVALPSPATAVGAAWFDVAWAMMGASRFRGGIAAGRDSGCLLSGAVLVDLVLPGAA